MLDNKLVETGNYKLDVIIQQLHSHISVLNVKPTLQLFNYYNIKSCNSISIPAYEQPTNNNTAPSLFKVSNDGIYDINYNHRICSYKFYKGNKVIYINNDVFIIDFIKGKMFRFNTTTNVVSECSYPSEYTFVKERNSTPSINETMDGNLITIGGFLNNECSRIVKIYNINRDSWLDYT